MSCCLVCIICVLFVWVVFLSFLYTSNTASMISTCTLMHMDTYYIVCICTCVTAYHLQVKCVHMLCVLRLNWPSIYPCMVLQVVVLTVSSFL